MVIVGGGAAGLSAAWRLARSGFEDFVLLELEKVPGGTARSGVSPVCAYPWGAHYIPVPGRENRALVALLEEMGILEGKTPDGDPVVAEQFLCRDPQERIFYRGTWSEGLYLSAGADREDRRQLAAFQAEVERWVGWRDGRNRRAFTIPMACGSTDAEVTELDRISMADFLTRKGWNSPRLRWYVDYACRDDYGSRLEDTSAWAGLFYFASRVPRQGAESEPLITWPEGNGRLIAHLFGKVAGRVLLGLAASEVAPAPPGTGGKVSVTAASEDGRRVIGYRADQVIFAAPRFLEKPLIRELPRSRADACAAFEYGSWMVANLTLRDRPAEGGFPLCWDNVLYESPSLGYVVATHQTEADRGPTVLTYYYPFCDREPKRARERLLSLGWRDGAELALADLSLPHPGIRRLTERIDVMRWGHAMVRPRPGFVWGGDREEARRPFGGIHFAHTDLSGLALFEEAQYHGIRAAEEVLAARRLPFESLL